MRIVAPYRPFPSESAHHRAQVDFDWIAALQMMATSATRACRCPVHVLTDVDTDVPLPMLQYATTQRRLMLWTLEVCAAYLASDDFTCDTVMLDADQLIYQDLAPWFTGADLGVLIRPGKMAHNGLLNGVQWWAVAAKDRLVAFYQQALALAAQMSEEKLVWGADTDAVRALLEPLAVGVQPRAGLRVSMIQSASVLTSFSTAQSRALRRGRLRSPATAVLDFRSNRKLWMADVYAATMGASA